jgi:hypothetical protein
MRTLLLVLGLGLLAGCSVSPEERRAEGPTDSYSTDKTVDAVSSCILFSWQEYKWYGQPMQALIQPNQHGGKTVLMAQTQLFVDILPADGKTRVSYYGSGAIGKELKPRVRSCI